MRQSILTRVVRLVGVTRPYPAGTLSSTSRTAEASSCTLAKAHRTLPDEQPRVGSSSYMGRRQEYSAVRGSSNQQATTQEMSSPTGTSGVHTSSVERPVRSIPSRNLVPHWDYRSHSIAAACIMIIIFAVSFLVLLALYFKKVHNFCRRRKRERNNYSPPKNSSYDSPVVLEGESMSSSTAKMNEDEKAVNPSSSNGTRSFDTRQSRPPSPGFVVEEDPAIGSVVRVCRAVRSKMPKNPVRNVLPALSPPRCGSVKKKQLENDASTETIPKEKTCALRNVETERPLIMVPPALTHRPSMCAARETHSSPGDYAYHGGHSDLESSDESHINRYSDPGPEPDRVSYLPKIHPSGLPLFNLEGLRFG